MHPLLAHQHFECRRGGALGRRHFLAQLLRRKIGAPQQLARALDRRPRQPARQLGVEAGGARGRSSPNRCGLFKPHWAADRGTPNGSLSLSEIRIPNLHRGNSRSCGCLFPLRQTLECCRYRERIATLGNQFIADLLWCACKILELIAQYHARAHAAL